MEYREDRARQGTGRGGWNYPDTSITLLGRLKASGADVDDAAWARFVDVYGPVVHHVVRLLSPNLQDADVDDIVQDVFVRLVGVLRSGAYDPNRAKFRTFLSTLARRILVDRYRAAGARRADRMVGIECAEEIESGDDPGAVVDAKWCLACRMSAERRVMDESALSRQSREIWRLLSVEGLGVKEVAEQLQIPSNTVSKVKCRIEAMIDAMARMYCD